MENEDVVIKEDSLRKSQMTLRCAKSAMLLLSLKSSPNILWKTPDHEEEEKEIMVRTIKDLRIELIKARIQSRKMMFCSLAEVNKLLIRPFLNLGFSGPRPIHGTSALDGSFRHSRSSSSWEALVSGRLLPALLPLMLLYYHVNRDRGKVPK
ncbi:hypothetical protein Nepgr_023709 [Nepenthes gracilis]|uniref:Uncharacterized protein n=1 Tax=Nepenthes gracilis TaxID=150966 RepID=A0AAD3T3B5_NEPGR|nr:hypothetical protein Nepgr_023709 [Nepenthes gracilis]